MNVKRGRIGDQATAAAPGIAVVAHGEGEGKREGKGERPQLGELGELAALGELGALVGVEKMSRVANLMVKDDRRTFPSSSSELEDDDDTQLVRKRPLRPNLRWRDYNYQDQSMLALHQMRKQKHFCDVVLQIGNKGFHAHRAVLAAASPYFMELFTSKEDEPSRKEIQGGLLYELNGGFTREALEKLIDYAYTARLDVPGDHVKPVYLAAIRLRMDRAAAECAKFLANHLDLSSCLELRSEPGVTTSSRKQKSAASSDAEDSRIVQKKEREKKLVHTTSCTENGLNGHNPGTTGEEGEDVNLVDEVDKYIAANVEQLRDSKHLRSLPRVQIEVLHVTREEREAALMQPLCELILDWSQRQWLDDGSLNLENFASKRYLLFLAADNTLQDCDSIADGTALDSEIIQDYKKGNLKHLQLNPIQGGRKQRRSMPSVKPAKPREMLYSRHINQNNSEKDDEDSEWKIIASHKLDDQSILAVASLDGQLTTLSVMQRVNRPSSPSATLQHQIDVMSRSFSNQSLSDGSISSLGKSKSPRLSRPESLERDNFVPVACMTHAKCGLGTESFQGKLIVCGGYDRGECLNYVETFDVETNTWHQLPSMKNNRGRFSVTCVNDSTVYAVAGSNGQAEISSVEKLEAGSDKWVKCAPLPVQLSNTGVCNLNGFVYCIGGTHGPTGTKYCFKYISEENTWERIANLNIGRFQAAVACFQGQIWAVGGCDGWNPLNTVEVYDPTMNVWKMGPALNAPRRGGGLAVRKGKLILVGGSDGTHSLCSTEVLDPLDGVWTPGPTLTTRRTNVAVATVGTRLYAVGGFSGKSFLNTIEYIDPETDEWTTYIPMESSKLDPIEPEQKSPIETLPEVKEEVETVTLPEAEMSTNDEMVEDSKEVSGSQVTTPVAEEMPKISEDIIPASSAE